LIPGSFTPEDEAPTNRDARQAAPACRKLTIG
jgi:hypothetical protein